MRCVDLFVVILLAVTIGCANARDSEFNGVPKVVDGDTVQFGDTKLQMEGISKQLLQDAAKPKR
jgi:hypothetical protein